MGMTATKFRKIGLGVFAVAGVAFVVWQASQPDTVKPKMYAEVTQVPQDIAPYIPPMPTDPLNAFDGDDVSAGPGIPAAQVMQLVQGTISAYVADKPDLYEERAALTPEQKTALREVFTKAAAGTLPATGVNRKTLPNFMQSFQNAVASQMQDDLALTTLDVHARTQLNTIFFDREFNRDGRQSLYHYLEHNL